jgi:hypothetical protein
MLCFFSFELMLFVLIVGFNLPKELFLFGLEKPKIALSSVLSDLSKTKEFLKLTTSD